MIRRFANDEAGNVAALFALMAPIVVTIVGGSIDVGRWLAAREITTRAMDSAILAAGRSMQINGNSTADAVRIAERYYDENKSDRLSSEDVQFTVSSSGNEITATTNATISTPFLSILGVEDLSIDARASAVLAAGGNAGTNLEISIMMDITGSMCSPCSKIEDLKLAAKDLIDIAIWEDQSEYTSRVALVPFAQLVNVGRNNFRAVTGANPSGSGDQRSCVAERADINYLYSEETPTGNRRFLRWGNFGTCWPQNPIVPLSSDKVALKTAIDGLRTGGGTAGHLGTAWAWYTLSPSFNPVWPDDLGADAAPYSDIFEMNTVTVGDATYEVQKLKKIAVLMTDGVYNVRYRGPNSATQALALCSEMKERGIEVYAVGFEIGTSGPAFDVMQGCASSDDTFYNAIDGDQLRQAFRDIGLRVSTLRLSE